jgi:hypothetical protein
MSMAFKPFIMKENATNVSNGNDSLQVWRRLILDKLNN